MENLRKAHSQNDAVGFFINTDSQIPDEYCVRKDHMRGKGFLVSEMPQI